MLCVVCCIKSAENLHLSNKKCKSVLINPDERLVLIKISTRIWIFNNLQVK